MKVSEEVQVWSPLRWTVGYIDQHDRLLFSLFRPMFAIYVFFIDRDFPMLFLELIWHRRVLNDSRFGVDNAQGKPKRFLTLTLQSRKSRNHQQ